MTDLLRLYMEPAVAVIAQKIERDLLDLYAALLPTDKPRRGRGRKKGSNSMQVLDSPPATGK